MDILLQCELEVSLIVKSILSIHALVQDTQ